MAGRPANLRINITSDSRQAQDDVAQASTGITGQMEKLKQAGPALAAAAGAAVAAGIIAGFSEALEQGKVTAKLAAQLGATPKEAAKYGKLAGELYAEGIASDFQTAADAISATMRSGLADPGATKAQLKDISTAVSDLTYTFDQESSQVARAVAQMLKTGLADSAEEAFDVLTRGFQTGGNAADDLLDTFSEYSTQFRDLGLDGKQAIGLITQGLAGGARDADIVADALKELNIRVKSFDPNASAGLKTLGLNAREMADAFARGGPQAEQALDKILDGLRDVEDPAKRNQIAFALLGTQAEDLAAALYSIDPSTAAGALGEVEGAANRMGDALRDNATQEVLTFWRTAKQYFVDFLAEDVIPIAARLANFWRENVGPAIREIRNAFYDAEPAIDAVRKAWRDLNVVLDENDTELGLVWRALRPVVQLLGYIAFGTLAGVLQFFTVLAWAVGQSVDQIKDLWHWLRQVYNLLRNFPDLPDGIPGIGLGLTTGFAAPAAAAAAGPSLLAAPLAAGLAAPALSAQTLSSSLVVPLTVHVTIDGQQLQGRIDRTVTGAMNQDGARFRARGWY